MTDLQDPDVRELLDGPNYAVLSTQGGNGSIHSTIVWADYVDGVLAVNTAVGRRWPTNLEQDPNVTLVVYEGANPYHFVEVRGVASGTLDGADEHIDALAKKYTGQDKYPWRQPGEQRIKYQIEPKRVRLVKM